MTATGCTFAQGTDAQNTWHAWTCRERNANVSTPATDTDALIAERTVTSPSTTTRPLPKGYAEGNEPGETTNSEPSADAATRGSEGS